MKIRFKCPSCGQEDHIKVFAVGWKGLVHRCSNCGLLFKHRYHQLRSGGLALLASFASVGIAFIFRLISNVSWDVSLVVMLASLFVLVATLGSKSVELCSSWVQATGGQVSSDGALPNDRN